MYIPLQGKEICFFLKKCMKHCFSQLKKIISLENKLYLMQNSCKNFSIYPPNNQPRG